MENRKNQQLAYSRCTNRKARRLSRPVTTVHGVMAQLGVWLQGGTRKKEVVCVAQKLRDMFFARCIQEKR